MIAALAMLVASVVTGTALAVDQGSVSDAGIGTSQTDTDADTDSDSDGGEVEAAGESGSAAAEDADDVASGVVDAEGYSAASDEVDVSGAVSVEVGGPGSFMVSVPVSDGDDAESIDVTVDVPEEAFDGGVTLLASMVADDDGAVADALADADVDYDGLLALDVRFEDSDGDEIEPEQPVGVTFELPASALGGDVDASSIVVSHLVEDADGNIESVDTVADAGDASDGTVTLDGVTALSADSEVSDSSTVTAEFTVDSFSMFTITWGNSNALTAQIIDSEGHSIGSGSLGSTSISSETDIDDIVLIIAEQAGTTLEGYKFVKAVVASNASNAVNSSSTQVQCIRRSGNRWQYSTQANGNSWQSINKNNTLYLVYEARTGLYIEDSVAVDGMFTAEFGKNVSLDDATVKYTWYRSLTGGEDAEDWAKVQRQRVTGTEYNLSADGGSAVNVALDALVADAGDSDRYWYKVEAMVTGADGGTKEYTSEPLQVPYYMALQNGGFEAPVVGNWNEQLPNGRDGLIWQTTGVGTGDETGRDIEIARSTTGQWATYRNQYMTFQRIVEQVYSVSSAADEDQFAELNCEAYGALYQDVLTVPGSTLYWQLSHAGRSGTDTMALVIMPVSAAEDLTEELENISSSTSLTENEKTAAAIRNAISSAVNEVNEGGSSSVAYTEEFSDKSGAWTKHSSGSDNGYMVPAGQYLTRFFFVAVDTASGSATVGNLLDDVSFSKHVPKPDDDEGRITVTKVVEGYDPGGDYSVTITAKQSGDNAEAAGQCTISWFTSSGTGDDTSYTGECTVTISDMKANSSAEYTVSETVNNAPSGYDETSTVQVGEGDSQSDVKVTNVTVSAGGTATVTFTNSYSRIVQPVSSLPLTGGSGTGLQLLLTGGMLGLLAAGAWLLARRRGAMV